MSLHIAVMVVSLGTATPAVTAHPAHPAPLIVTTCPGGAILDLRAATVARLAPGAPPHPTISVLVQRYPAPVFSVAPASPSVQRVAPTVTAIPPPIRTLARHRPISAPRRGAVHKPLSIRDNGVWRVSAPPGSTSSGLSHDPAPGGLAWSFLHPQPTIYDAFDPRNDPVQTPITGRTGASESHASEFIHGLGDGVKACGIGAAVGAGTAAGATTATTVLSGGSAGLPSAAVTGAAAVGGCVGNVIRHALTSL